MREKRLWVDIGAESPIISEYEDFTKYGIFVGNLFTFYLPKITITKMSKILIEFSLRPDALWIWASGSIHHLQETFPLDEFLKEDFSGKIRLLAESVYKCLAIFYKEVNLDLAQLDFGYEQILGNDFKLSKELLKGLKHNKARTTKAIVIADYLFGYTQVKINFLDKCGVVIREIVLFKTWPGWFAYTHLLKSARWIDNEIFELSGLNKEMSIRAKADGEISIHYAPVGRDVDGIKEEIRFFTSEITFEI